MSIIMHLNNLSATAMIEKNHLPANRRSKMAEDTQLKLLQSAKDAFTNQGYAATSMDEFTASVGLTRGALYHHFGSKKGLFAAVVRQLDNQIDAKLLTISDRADNAWQGIYERGVAYLQMALQADIQQILLKDAKAVLGGELQRIQMQCVDSVSHLLACGIADGSILACDTCALAVLLNGSLTESAFWIAQDEQPAKRLMEAIAAWQMLMNGLKTK